MSLRGRVAVLAIVFFLQPVLLYGKPLDCDLLEAQENLLPWEVGECTYQSGDFGRVTSPARLPSELSIWLIHRYQAGSAIRSIRRCPFYPSCSNFAIEAIQRHGFLMGLCRFIDRNLYRENPQMYYLYDYIQIGDGSLKLDDRYFLGVGD